MTNVSFPEIRFAPLFEGTVLPEWIDYNGHMNDTYYALVFSRTVDALMTKIGLDQDGRSLDSRTIYTLTLTIHYLAEVKEGEAIAADARILAHDSKRLHLWQEMRRGDGAIAAMCEQVQLCVDQSSGTPRAAPWLPDQMAVIERLHRDRAGEPMPKRAGAGISLEKRSVVG